MNAIELDRVSVILGEHPILDDVSIAVPAGRVTGLIGPNGAGKSTLMRLVLGHQRPTTGRVRLFGHPLTTYRTLFGVVGAAGESVGLDPALTGRRAITVIARAAGVTDDRVDAAIDAVGASTFQHERISRLSTGMRQRMALAAALLGNPSLLVLDEPTNGLDPDAVRWLRQYLQYFRATGGTVLVSSHTLGELEHCIDHLIVLDRQVLYAGTHAPLDDGDLEQRFFSLIGQAS